MTRIGRIKNDFKIKKKMDLVRLKSLPEGTKFRTLKRRRILVKKNNWATVFKRIWNNKTGSSHRGCPGCHVKNSSGRILVMSGNLFVIPIN